MLSYRIVGDGPPLLLVHGFGISFNIWRQLVPLLSPHFRLVMIELPGIGGSPLPPVGQDYRAAAIDGIEQVRTGLGIEKWAVLGYSSGSRIAEAYVSADAAHVSRAIFLCPAMVGNHKSRGLRLGLWLDEHVPAFGTWILSGLRLKFLISLLGFNLRRDPRSAAWYAEIGAAPVRVLKDTLRAITSRASDDLSVPVPYVTIWGDRDLVPLRPPHPGEHDHFVHGRHAAPVESAEEIAAVVIPFLEATKK